MNGAVNDDSQSGLPDDFLAADEELAETLDSEEELERLYGQPDRRTKHREAKVVGAGFAKQQEIAEKNRYYQGGKKRKIKIINRLEQK